MRIFYVEAVRNKRTEQRFSRLLASCCGQSRRRVGPGIQPEPDVHVLVGRAGNPGNNQQGAAWVVTTPAGLPGSLGSADGRNSAARIGYPMGMELDNAGKFYVVVSCNSTLRRVTPVLQSPSLINGQYGFGITGLPNLAGDIECADDLFQWQMRGTYILEGGTN